MNALTWHKRGVHRVPRVRVYTQRSWNNRFNCGRQMAPVLSVISHLQERPRDVSSSSVDPLNYPSHCRTHHGLDNRNGLLKISSYMLKDMGWIYFGCITTSLAGNSWYGHMGKTPAINEQCWQVFDNGRNRLECRPFVFDRINAANVLQRAWMKSAAYSTTHCRNPCAVWTCTRLPSILSCRWGQ